MRATQYHGYQQCHRADDTPANVGDWIPNPPVLIPAVQNDPPDPYRQWNDQLGMQISRERMPMKMDIYRNAFNFGEAPDSLLAVENVATAANIPVGLLKPTFFLRLLLLSLPVQIPLLSA